MPLGTRVHLDMAQPNGFYADHTEVSENTL